MKTYDELALLAKDIKPENTAEFLGYLKALKIPYEKKTAEDAASRFTSELANKTIAQARARCYVKSNAQYDRYGGAGVTISEEFQDKAAFMEFLIGLEGYGEPLYRIDRLNLSKGYERGNIRWAPKSECNEILHAYPGRSKEDFVFYIPNSEKEFRTDVFADGVKWLNVNF